MHIVYSTSYQRTESQTSTRVKKSASHRERSDRKKKVTQFLVHVSAEAAFLQGESSWSANAVSKLQPQQYRW
jgi:hypothetical protein